MKGFPASALALQATARTAAAWSHPNEPTSRGISPNAAVQPFGGGAYMVTDGSYQNVFFVLTAGAILVDLRPTIGKNMFFVIGNVTSQPITHMVYSHSHEDHIGVASLVAGPGKPVEIIAHEDTKGLLQEVPDASRPLPAVTFKDDYKLCVGQPDAGAAL